MCDEHDHAPHEIIGLEELQQRIEELNKAYERLEAAYRDESRQLALDRAAAGAKADVVLGLRRRAEALRSPHQRPARPGTDRHVREVLAEELDALADEIEGVVR
jgi:hypothetical protein